MAEMYPRYNRGGTISSVTTDEYACHICAENLGEPWEDHLTSEDHLLRFEYYVRSFVDHNLSFVICKICDRWIDKSSVASHALAHGLMPWCRPENESEIFFTNFVSKHDDFYYCHLCRLKIPHWYLAISHTDDQEHQHRRKDRLEECSVEGLSLSPDFYELFIGNFIFPRTANLFQCAVCCCYVNSLHTSIYDHIEDDPHKINEQKLHDEVSKMKKHFSSFRLGNNMVPVRRESKGKERADNKNRQVAVVSLQLSSHKFSTIFNDSEETEGEKFADEHVVKLEEKQFLCRLCNCRFSGRSKNIDDHLNGTPHQENLWNKKSSENPTVNLQENSFSSKTTSKKPARHKLQVYECFQCNCKVRHRNADNFYQIHNNSRRHLENVEKQLNKTPEILAKKSTADKNKVKISYREEKVENQGNPVDPKINPILPDGFKAVTVNRKNRSTPKQSPEQFHPEEVYLTKCLICNCFIFGGENSVTHHKTSQPHQVNRSSQSFRENPVFSDSRDTKYFMIEKSRQTDKHIVEIVETTWEKKQPLELKVFWCLICEWKITSELQKTDHEKRWFHMEKLKSAPSTIKFFDCKICACKFRKFNQFSEEDHKRTRMHLDNLETIYKKNFCEENNNQAEQSQASEEDQSDTSEGQSSENDQSSMVQDTHTSEKDQNFIEDKHSSEKSQDYVGEDTENVERHQNVLDGDTQGSEEKQHLSDTQSLEKMKNLTGEDPQSSEKTQAFTCKHTDSPEKDQNLTGNDVYFPQENQNQNQNLTGENNQTSEENQNDTREDTQTLETEKTQVAETAEQMSKAETQEEIKMPDTAENQKPQSSEIDHNPLSILFRDLPEGIEHIHDNIYLCTLCNRLLDDEPSIKEHAETQSHIESGPKVIFRKDSVKFFCTACNVVIDSFFILRQHLKATRHSESFVILRQHLQKQMVCPPCSPDTELCVETGETSPPAAENKSKGRGLSELGIERCRSGQFWCKPCDMMISELIKHHRNRQSHLVNFTKWKNKKLLASSAQAEDKKGENKRSSQVNSSEISDESRREEVFFTQCTICKCYILGHQPSLAEHNHSAGHQRRERKVLRKNPLLKKSSDSPMTDGKHRYYIVQSKENEPILTLLQVSRRKPTGIKVYWCQMCHARCESERSVREHVSGAWHRANLRQLNGNNTLGQPGSSKDNRPNGAADLVNAKKSSETSSKKTEKDKTYNESEMNLIEDLFDSPQLDHSVDSTCDVENKFSVKSEENLKSSPNEPKTEEASSVLPLKVESTKPPLETNRQEPNEIGVQESSLMNGEREHREDDTEPKVKDIQPQNETDAPKSQDSDQKLSNIQKDAQEVKATQKPNEVDSPKVNGSDQKCANNLADWSDNSLVLSPKPKKDEVKEEKKKKVPAEAIVGIHYKGSVIDSIECKACNVKFLGNYETTAEAEYDTHVTTKKHLESAEKFAENWREAKPVRPVIKHFTVVPKMTQICHVCNAKVEDISKLHIHLARHFWKRFTSELDSVEEEEIPIIPEDSTALNVHVESANREAEEKQEEKPKDPETPKETRDSALQIKNVVKKKLDIRYKEKGVKVDLYKTNARKLQDVKLGLILSYIVDSKKIYCLVCQKDIDNVLQNFYEHLCSINHMKNLKVMKNDHKVFKKFPGQFSDLALGFEYIEEVSDTSVQCHACQTSFNNDTSDIIKHIKQKSHSEKCSLLKSHNKRLFDAILSQMEADFYSTQRYWCVLCDTVFRLEILFREHLRGKLHMKRVNSYERKKQQLTIDYCAVCATVWFGFSKTFGYHLECKMHRFHRMDRFYMISKLPTSAETLLASPEKQVDEMLKILDEETESMELADKSIVKDLEECVKERYPEAKAHGFGSRVSGLGGATSDLDIFLDCRARWSSVYGGKDQTPRQIEYRLRQVRKCLESSQDMWRVQGEILNCRIPIIKAIHRPTEVECDISFTNGLTVENTALIRAYCEKYPHCRKLIIFVKNWMNHCDLMGHKGVVSYGVAWLVIYFLQIKSIVPTVSQLIEMKNKSRKIAGWETGFSREFETHPGDDSFTTLLTQFFRFYATFDYRNYVMCPLMGENIKKLDFQKLNKLPTDMEPYVSYIDRTRDPDILRIDALMCLQDPFELCHNVTKAVKKFTLYKFRCFCSMSAKILDENCVSLT